MRYWRFMAIIGTLAAPALAAGPSAAVLLPGVFSNAEQPRAIWTSLRIVPAAGGYSVQPIDAFGAATGAPTRWRVTETADRVSIVSGPCTRDFARVPAGFTIINQRGACAGRLGITAATDRGLGMVDAQGRPLEMARARGFACSVNGTKLSLHDTGGRVAASGHMLLLRHIPFPFGNDIAALKLAILPAAGDTPLATAVTEASATRIGISVPGVDAMCRLAESAQIPG